MTEKTHARFGGSSCSRWMNCVGSTCLIGGRESPDSPYAAEGTAAHEMAERCLNEGDRDALLYVGETAANGHVFTEDMAAAVQVYIDAVWAEVDAAPDAHLHVEQKFALADDMGGTNDALVYTPSRKRLAVFDYKHGVGVSVFADNNAQLKFYAVGAALSNKWALRDIELVIVQPRAFDADKYGPIRTWQTDPVELIDFSNEITNAVQAAMLVTTLGDAHENLKAGEWCKFCPAAAACPAREKEFLAKADLQFGSIVDITKEDLPAVDTMDTERLSRILAAADLLNDWIGQVQAEVTRLLLDEGVPVPGWKVVEKIARAKWVESDEKIAAYLALAHDLNEDDLRPRKLVTITEAERQIKVAITDKDARAKALDDLRVKFTQKESGDLTIAPATDRREAVTRAAIDFKVDETLTA